MKFLDVWTWPEVRWSFSPVTGRMGILIGLMFDGSQGGWFLGWLRLSARALTEITGDFQCRKPDYISASNAASNA